jgi:hypothetical protein
VCGVGYMFVKCRVHVGVVFKGARVMASVCSCVWCWMLMSVVAGGCKCVWWCVLMCLMAGGCRCMLWLVGAGACGDWWVHVHVVDGRCRSVW